MANKIIVTIEVENTGGLTDEERAPCDEQFFLATDTVTYYLRLLKSGTVLSCRYVHSEKYEWDNICRNVTSLYNDLNSDPRYMPSGSSPIHMRYKSFEIIGEDDLRFNMDALPSFLPTHIAYSFMAVRRRDADRQTEYARRLKANGNNS